MNDSIISEVNHTLDFFFNYYCTKEKYLFIAGAVHIFLKKDPIKAREEKMSGMAIGMFEMQNANACHIAAT